jgi:hypothetical protein
MPPAGATLFDRLDAIVVEKSGTLSDADLDVVREMYDTARELLEGVDRVEAAIRDLVPAEEFGSESIGSEPGGGSDPYLLSGERARPKSYPARFLNDTRRERDDFRVRTVEGYYDDVVDYLNRAYGTDLSKHTLFAEELEFRSALHEHRRREHCHERGREGARGGESEGDLREGGLHAEDALLKPEGVDARVSSEVGTAGLTEAGRATVIERLARIAAGRRGVKVGRTFVDFPNCIYFDTWSPDQISYNSRETFRYLADALWHFERPGDNAAPTDFLSEYTVPNTPVPEGKEPFPYHVGFEKLGALTVYRNGKVRVHFESASAARAFVSYYGIGLS